MRRSLNALIPALFCLSLIAPAAHAQRSRDAWVSLGQREVTDRVDHDLIPVTAAKGEYRRIKLTVQRAPVDFHRVVVHFGDGSKQEVEMRNTIRAGGETRAIDLEGGDRVIRSVEFWYDAKTILPRRRASVHVFGLR